MTLTPSNVSTLSLGRLWTLTVPPCYIPQRSRLTDPSFPTVLLIYELILLNATATSFDKRAWSKLWRINKGHNVKDKSVWRISLALGLQPAAGPGATTWCQHQHFRSDRPATEAEPTAPGTSLAHHVWCSSATCCTDKEIVCVWERETETNSCFIAVSVVGSS